MVFEIYWFQELHESTPSPNKGKIMVRLYWFGEVLNSTPIATYTVIFIQIGQLFRKISTDNFFAHTDRQTTIQTDRQTDRQTDGQADTHTHVKLKTSFLGVSVLAESGNVLSSASNF